MTGTEAGAFDAIIIGAGVIGSSIAFSLARSGLKTLNVDALPAAGYGSTSHSSAIIRPFYSHVEAASLAHEARHRWLGWSAFLGAPSDEPLATYTECGLLSLLTEEGDDAAAACAAMTKAGVPWTRLSPHDLETRFPGMSLKSFAPVKQRDDESFGIDNGGRVIGAVHVPDAGFVNDPALAAQNLKAAAERGGATFRFNAKVVGIRQDKNRVLGITLADGTKINAPVLINAAGPHSSVINQLAGQTGLLPIATKAMRHEVVYLPWPRALESTSARTIITDLDTGVYTRPDGADMLVGTLDPPCDTPDVVDPDDYNNGFTDHWTTQAWRAGQRFPELEIPEQARGTIGLYDVSDDWIPIYDRSELGGYYLAIGTSGNQFKNAPMVGDLMTRIILECEEGHDHDTDPLTLTLPKLQRTISLAHYSRLRDVQKTANVLA